MSERYHSSQEPSDREKVMNMTGKSYQEVYAMSNYDVERYVEENGKGKPNTKDKKVAVSSKSSNPSMENLKDIITVGKNEQTAHRPDGKFLSNYELEMIAENQDLIRNSQDLSWVGQKQKRNPNDPRIVIQPPMKIKTPTAVFTHSERTAKKKPHHRTAGVTNDHAPHDSDVSLGWRAKIGAGGFAVSALNYLQGRSVKAQEKYLRYKESTKEAWSNKKYVRALALGGVATIAALGLAAKLDLIRRSANATGLDAEMLAAVPDLEGGFIPDFTPESDYNNPHEGVGIKYEHENRTTSDIADYLRSEGHKNDRMSTEGLYDGVERSNTQVDTHVLEKIKNNPSLMASVLEVQESGSKDRNFSLDEVNRDIRSYTEAGQNGEFSEKGHAAEDKLERTWSNGEQGKIMKEAEVRKLLQTHDFINHGTTEGAFENARDDKTYRAGIFDYRPDLGDQVYRKELGNGHVAFFKVNERDPSRDCLNVQTLVEKVSSAETPMSSIPESTTEPTPAAELGQPEPQAKDRAELTSQDSKLEEPKKPAEQPQESTPTPTPPAPSEEQPETPALTPKDPTKAPTGHDNGDHLAPTPKPTPDSNIDGVTGGTPQHPQPEATTPRPPEKIPPAESAPAVGGKSTSVQSQDEI